MLILPGGDWEAFCESKGIPDHDEPVLNVWELLLRDLYWSAKNGKPLQLNPGRCTLLARLLRESREAENFVASED